MACATYWQRQTARERVSYQPLIGNVGFFALHYGPASEAFLPLTVVNFSGGPKGPTRIRTKMGHLLAAFHFVFMAAVAPRRRSRRGIVRRRNGSILPLVPLFLFSVPMILYYVHQKIRAVMRRERLPSPENAQFPVGNLTLWLKSQGSYDRNSTESSNKLR